MQLPKDLEDIVRKLTQKDKSPHFIVIYEHRNPTAGRGLWPGGVRDRALVLAYLDALERLYATMTEPPWKRQPPIVGSEGKTIVYVFDTSKILLVDDGGFAGIDLQAIPVPVPYIGLPYRYNEPTTQAELYCAAAQAIHEATHVFNFRKRPPLDPNSASWVWFNEAMAVFMETLVMSGNPDYLRFIMNWSDRPDIPIDDWTAMYQASMFVRYLSRRMGLRFINKVWTESYSTETPFEAISRLLPKSLKLSSPSPKHRDLFSDYCMDSYFLLDPESLGFAPEIYERYRERAIEKSFVLGPNGREMNENHLDHLACRYYRFYLKTGVVKLQVRLQTPGTYSNTPLKAELATVTKEMRKGIVKPLSTKSSPGPGGSVQLFAELSGIDWENIEHVVLVVSNCGLRAAKINPNIAHDDGQEYTIEASAL